ncbi:hypothetical protein Tdes44962_MAKER00678 [Teratosphaeria destructans]|uniref:Uncharacterized protein n=1 Tax=Teratosphaeria destructans TaxID=418781 RepID=A0A9W7SNP2_9PEZI|nr:hypothetical protein Tdes44962_MAKER00678 [Teratosphaeria destructans]
MPPRPEELETQEDPYPPAPSIPKRYPETPVGSLSRCRRKPRASLTMRSGIDSLGHEDAELELSPGSLPRLARPKESEDVEPDEPSGARRSICSSPIAAEPSKSEMDVPLRPPEDKEKRLGRSAAGPRDRRRLNGTSLKPVGDSNVPPLPMLRLLARRPTPCSDSPYAAAMRTSVGTRT